MVEKAPKKKAVAKKTTRKTTTKKVASKKVASKKVAAKKTTSTETQRRKAPTPIAAVQARKTRDKRVNIAVLSVFVVILGVSVGIGLTDNGVIDINSAVEERKRNASETELARIENISVQNTKPSTPDGGLVGSSQKAPEVVPEEVADTASSSDASASSTEALATTTEAVAEEEAVTEEVVTQESVDSNDTTEASTTATGT